MHLKLNPSPCYWASLANGKIKERAETYWWFSQKPSSSSILLPGYDEPVRCGVPSAGQHFSKVDCQLYCQFRFTTTTKGLWLVSMTLPLFVSWLVFDMQIVLWKWFCRNQSSSVYSTTWHWLIHMKEEQKAEDIQQIMEHHRKFRSKTNTQCLNEPMKKLHFDCAIKQMTCRISISKSTQTGSTYCFQITSQRNTLCPIVDH